MSRILQGVKGHRMLLNKLARCIFLITTALLILPTESSASARARYLGGTLSTTKDADIVSLALMTPNGRETFLLSKSGANTESPNRSYEGFSQRRAGKANRDRAAMIIAGSDVTVFFSSRRTGRPVAVSFTLLSDPSRRNFVGDLRLSRAERGATIPCANERGKNEEPQTVSADGLGMYANKLAATTKLEAMSSSEPLFTPPREIQVAAYADGQFVSIHRRRTSAYMESSLLAASSLYMAPLGLRIKVVSSTVPSASARSSEGEDAERVLEQFRTRQVTSFRSADLHHLFTGRSFNDSTIGIAYVASACTAGNRYAVGLSKQVKTALQPLVAAHELAHGLSAVHDNESLSIMNPALTTSNNHFSEATRLYLTEYITGAGSCVAPAMTPETTLTVAIKDSSFSASAVLRSWARGDCSIILQGMSSSSRWRTVAARHVTISQPGDTVSATFTTPSPLYTERRARRFPFRVVAQCPGGRSASAPQLVNPAGAGIAAISSDAGTDWLSALITSFRQTG
jgi:hypothetical protein